MADTSNSISMPNENPVGFAPADWLSQFESIGGGFLATDSQTSLCIACQGTTPEKQSAAHAMLRDLTDEQRAAVIAYIRERAGLFGRQPDLKAVSSQAFSEPAGTEPPPSGPALGQSEGSQHMDMTHSFAPTNAKFESANQAYVAADKAMNDFHDQFLTPASNIWSAWRDQWPRETSDDNPEYAASRDAASALYDPVQGQFDHLVEECSKALMALSSTPAGDIGAITRKVQVLIDAQEWDGGECESHLKNIMVDLQNLGVAARRIAIDGFNRTGWDRAHREYRCAKLRMDAYYALGPMKWAIDEYEYRQSSKESNPIAFKKALDRLRAEENASQTYFEPAISAAIALINTPAPNLDAVAIKIQAHKDLIEETGDAEIAWGPIEADLHRLANAIRLPAQNERAAA